MSLLNDMLEDLERRERPPVAVREATVASFVPRTRRWQIPAMALLAGLGLGSLGGLLPGLGLGSHLPGGGPAGGLPKVSSAPPADQPDDPMGVAADGTGPPGTANPLARDTTEAGAGASEQAAGFVPDSRAELQPAAQAVAPPASPMPPPPRRAPEPILRQSPAQLALEAAGEARELAAVGRLAAAEASWQRATRLDPTRNEIRVDAARVLAAAGKDAEALRWLAAARAEQPGRADLALLEAELLVRAKRGAEALAVLQEAEPGIRETAEAAGLEAALLQRAQRYQEAADAYERGLAAAPENARFWLGLAVSSEALGRRPAARKAFTSALEHPGLETAPRAYVRERLDALGKEQP